MNEGLKQQPEESCLYFNSLETEDYENRWYMPGAITDVKSKLPSRRYAVELVECSWGLASRRSGGKTWTEERMPLVWVIPSYVLEGLSRQAGDVDAQYARIYGRKPSDDAFIEVKFNTRPADYNPKSPVYYTIVRLMSPRDKR